MTQLMEAREARTLSRLKAGLAKLAPLVLDEPGDAPVGKSGAEQLLESGSRQLSIRASFPSLS